MKKTDLLLWLGSLGVAVVMLLLFSYTTSPLFSNSFTNDSSVYQLLGKYWAQGYLPYVDIWEQKGPFIFLVNALGYLITGDRIGVFLVQIPFWTVSIFYTFKTLNRAFSQVVSCLLTTMIAVVAAATLQGGDMTEEFVLPFIVLSIYLIYRWIERVEQINEIDHPAKYAFVYGLVLGISAMSRVTNALGICGAVFVIVVALSMRGRWLNLWQNALAYIGGVAIVVVPFVVYFAAHGALYDMWYGTVVFPFSYAAGSENHLNDVSVLKGFLLTFVFCYGLLLLALVNLCLKPLRLRSLVWLGASLPLMLWYVQSNGYGHYALLSVPYAAVIIIEASAAATLVNFKWFYKCVSIFAVFLLLLKSSLAIVGAAKLEEHPMPGEESFAALAAYLDKQPQPVKMAGYNVSPNFYLKYDIKPYYKMISEQDRLSQFNKDLRDEVVKTYSNGGAPLLVLSTLRETTKEHNPLYVKGSLKNHYDSIGAVDSLFVVYRLR